MKPLKYLFLFVFAVVVTSWAVVTPTSARLTVVQNQGSTALERGYRTGYSDGYQAGFADQSSQASRDFANKEDYKKADRAYVDVWGPIDDYRDGYQQGFEIGYAAGYDRTTFSSALPPGFKRRGIAGATTEVNQTQASQPVDAAPQVTTAPAPSNTVSTPAPDNTVATTASLSIPRNTIFLVELENSLSTDISQRGDPFQARVIEPREYAGAVIEGRITHVQRAGKLKGTAELQLSFEQLRLPDNRSTTLHAEVVEVLPDAGSSGVGEVDREGGVKGTDSTKNDISKVGAATGIGAIIGAIAGGGRGAAIGAAIGGSVGTAGVLSSRGKDIRLARGQRLHIRTAMDTNVVQ